MVNFIPELKTYLEYNDPLAIVFRSGSEDDPFVPRSNSLPIINAQITLLEIPSITHKVQISGLVEVTQEQLFDKKNLEANEFVVNYSNGNIQFHPSREGQVVKANFYSRGMILYPASRIYAIATENPDVVVTLQDYIDSLREIEKTLAIKLGEINEAIQKSIETTDAANVAIDNAIVATEDAQDAAREAYEAAETTKVNYLPYVMTFDEIATTYPNPMIGDTVQVATTGEYFRFNGVSWIPFSLMTVAVPKANEYIDGLMSKEDFVKVRDADIETYEKRAIIILLQSDFLSGVQPNLYRSPFKGEIVDITAFSLHKGTIDTNVLIEKTNDFENWSGITSGYLTLEADSHIANEVIIDESEINMNDYFRVNVIELDENITNLTIEIIVKTIKTEEL